MNNIINDLNRRYATKKFDPTKKISQEDFDILLETLRLTPSAFGLQPWKFIRVQNPETRKQLQAASRNQAQVVDASDLIVIAAQNTITPAYIDDYMQSLMETRKTAEAPTEEQIAQAMKYKERITGTIGARTPEELLRRSQKQAYIAMGFLLAACAEMKIDACPMEGFEPAKYNEILGLDALGLNAVLVIPVGYRAEDDAFQKLAKVRYPLSKLLINK